jgi:hypothetical protein
MVKYDIRKYAEGQLMLVRLEKKDYGKGLPPHVSQCIMLKESELDDLVKVISEYADQNRN